ncbi:MAG: sulfite exporter TauE/SafE family protein [Clostridia bacterium]|nr:sulfite exporter TauE/SafE family protein [Clostridia bacterium]
MKKITKALLGVLIGFTNIVVGSCGGIIAVESLKKDKLNQTQSHATAIAVILPLTVISAGMYLYRGDVKLSDSYIYIIPGLVGAIIGSWLLPKIPKKMLSKIFSVFIIYAGVRMILK